MNEEHYLIWAAVMDQEQLNPEHRKQLRKACSDTKTVAEFHDDKTTDSLLELLSESPKATDSFVLLCLGRYRQVVGAIVDSEIDDANTKSNPFEIVTSSSTKTDNPMTAEKVIQRKKKSTAWSAGLLALATLLVIGLFAFAIQQSGNNTVTEGPKEPTPNESSRPDSVEHSAEIELPDLVSKPENSNIDSQLIEGADLPKIGDGKFPENNSSLNRIVFAEVFDEDNAEWESPVGKQIGPGTYRLLKGNSVIQMDSLLGLFLFGPATVELNSEREIRLLSGRVFIDAANFDDGPLQIATRDANLKDVDGARFFSEVNSDGTNISLNEGRVVMFMKSDDRPVVLDNTELNHAFVNNSTNQPTTTVPELMIAQGAGDKYFAQVGVGQDASRSTSPNEFDKLLEEKLNSNSDTGVQNQLRTRINDFNQRLRQFQKQFQYGVPNQPGNESFQQFLPGMLNGQGPIPFGDPGNFEKFRQELEKQLRKSN